MKILVTGVNGQLGHDLVECLGARGHEAVGVDIADMDITDGASVDRVLSSVRPDAVIHCAAWTAVDAAEDAENLEKVRRVNAGGTAHIAEACEKLGCKLMYISTDYVFDGGGVRPWEPDDARHPLNVYGETKYEGELAVERLEKHFIVRIAWVFGVNGGNFVKTMLNKGKTVKALRVVSDQVGSPTYTRDLSRLLADMIVTDKYGTYHATNEGFCSWYDFACEIFRQAAERDPATYADVTVAPVDSSAYPAKAKRPTNSRMSKEKLTEMGFTKLPTWQNALSRYLTELGM